MRQKILPAFIVWSRESLGMRLGVLSFAILLAIASLAAAQQPTETLPGFKAENVLEARGIDNVSPFSGDPGVVIPIGPEYTLSNAFKWQLRAYYSVKFWNLQPLGTCPYDDLENPQFRYAFILGDSTLGVGWTLQLGYVVAQGPDYGWYYFSPDGGRHGVHLETANPNVTEDGSHLRITAIPDTTSPTSYKIEFPDGTTQYFEHQYMPHGPISGSSPDFTNLTGYQEAPEPRYGLKRVFDRFGNFVLQVNYDPANAWQVSSILLNPAGQASEVTFHWGTTNGSSVQWSVVDWIKFPEPGSFQRQVNFTYQPQPTSFPRNSFDTSNLPGHTPNCLWSGPNVLDPPLLQSVSYADSNTVTPSFGSFSYGFDYFNAGVQAGALRKITLPTGGTIEYTLGPTTGIFCLIIGAGGGCDPEGSGVSGTPQPPVDLPVNIQPHKAFLDHSMAVGSRKETDTTTGLAATTSYSRKLIGYQGCSTCDVDDSRLYRQVAVVAPGNDPGPTYFATRSYYTVGYLGFPPSLFEGVEVDRRFYSGESDTGTPIRTLIRCYGHSYTACGYRTSGGDLQWYQLQSTGPEPPQAEVTWYGAVPAGSDGGTCTGTNPRCTASTSSDYNSTARQYRISQVSSTLLGVPVAWGRRTITNWIPQTGAAWMLDLISYKQVADSSTPAPNDVTTNFNFDLDRGFLNNTTVTDGYGTRTDVFYHDAGVWLPKTETVSGSGTGLSGTSFIDNRTFDGHGLVLTSQRTGVPWKSFDVDRDPNTGLVIRSRDPNASLQTSYGYDALGRLKSIAPPGGEAPTTISYDSTTQTTVSRSGSDGNATWQQYRYDGLGRLVREIRQMPSGFSVRTRGYDTAGHANFVSEWAGCTSATGDCPAASPPGTTSSSFDPFGRARAITQADGSQATIDRTDGTIFFSDSLERVTVSVNGSPATTETRRDALGRIITVTEPAVAGVADVTNYTYNVLDKLATVSQSSQTRNFTYDAAGFLRSENTPEKGLVNYSFYDALGDVLTESFPSAGLTRNRTYDQAGRLTLLTSNEGGSRQYVQNQYDQNPQFNFSLGKLTTRYSGVAGSPDASDEFVYLDPAGRLSGQTTAVTGGADPSVTQSWQYNSLGLVAHHHHYRPGNASPFVVSTAYASGLPVTQYVNGIPMVKNITYRASGALASYKTGIGTGHDVTTTVGQDPSGIPRPREVYAIEEASGVRRFDTCGYSYDGAGNIVSMGPSCYDESGNIVATGPQDTFAYDGRSRLTSAALSGLGSQYYCYDRFGNRVDKRSDPSCPSTVWSDNRVPGAGNYDLRGNQTSNGSYTYDALDRMTQQAAGGFTYLYDAANERLAKASSGMWTYTFRDESSRVSAEFTNAGGTTTPSQDNVFLGNLLVASYSNGQLGGSGPVWTFYSSDHLGTPRLLTRIDGSIYETRRYWPFGDDVSSSTVQRIRFAAMERDSEATRYYDHARNHEFNLGRFLSPDQAQGNATEPQSWNRFSYAGNNPLKFVDPNGEEKYWAQEVASTVISAGSSVQAFGASLNQGGPIGIAADFVVGTAGSMVQGTGDMFNLGVSTGEAIGAGEDSFNTAIAVSKDAGRLGGWLLAVAGAGAAAEARFAGSELVQRAMSRAELQATNETKLIRGGKEGTHFVSDSINSDALRARQRLSLYKTPEARATLEVKKGVFSKPRIVKPANKMPGGGTERTATGKVKVKVVDETIY